VPDSFISSLRRIIVTIKSEWIHYGDQLGYLALPPKQANVSLPAVVVIPEVWGVDEHIEEVTRRIAASGYAALAPDIFAVGGERPAALTRERIAEVKDCGSRLAPGVLFNAATRETELAKLPEPEQSRVRETIGRLFGGLGQTQNFISPLRQAIQHLRTQQPETRGQKVACVGFCMGGGLSALLACEEPELSGAAVFYGNLPAAEKVAGINCPLIGFFGGNDARVNATIPGFEAAMRAAGKTFEPHIYPGVNHGFFNDTRAIYDVNAVRDAWPRLLTFFAHNLAAG
jgi:carboxymethylenebutenolidase